ncbi:MAG TPA: OmpH family outer membrane protein [Burkholderiaceae bacterium]|nr:OmpH family outer membrane protein [Burkholderiaceae bacterium]
MSRGKSLLSSSLCALLVFAATAASAQDRAKIGFVDTGRLMLEGAPAAAALKKLDGEFSERNKELQAQAARLQSLTERFNRDSALLRDSELAARQREIVSLENTVRRRQEELKEDFARRRSEELAQVSEVTRRVVRQVAEAGNYDLVLESDGVYVGKQVDITDKVIQALANVR